VKEFWEKHKANIGLAVLVLYTLSLAVATTDQIFGLGLFPAKLDRMIAESIEKFDSNEEKVRKEGVREIIEYGDFSVPQLIKALDKDSRTRDLAVHSLNKITEQEFKDIGEWKDWYKRHKDQF
jgi:hypothetical protein